MFLFASCSGNDMSVQTYKSKKIELTKSNTTDQSSKGSIKWVAPATWTSLKANSIRIASYSLPTKDGMKAEASIITLSGDGGGDLANINRWRGQLSLGDLTLVEVQRLLVNLKGKLGSYKYLSLHNKEKGRSILAAFIQVGGKTIYVKAIGDTSLINSQEKSFKKFVEGIYED